MNECGVPGAEKKFNKAFSSELYRVRAVLAEAMAYVRYVLPEIARQDEMDLRLIFSELLFNAVIHGNKHDITKKVLLEIEIKDNVVCCGVSDEGSGFDYQRVISGFVYDVDIFSEHGRGIRLVQSLSDKLEFNVTGNEIRVHKKAVLDE